MLNHIEKRLIVGYENLDVIAHFGELGGRADEIRNQSWRSVPDENVIPFSAQNISDTASDYPEADDPLKQPAIVLIDELDLHLHPRWQRQIRSHISDAFPEVQFIATAHSPLLAQSYLDTNLAVIRQEHGQGLIENDPKVVRTWRLDEVVTSILYEVDSPYSLEVTRDLKRLGANPEENIDAGFHVKDPEGISVQIVQA